MRIMAVVTCPCCDGKGKLNILWPDDEAAFQLEYEFKVLEISRDKKDYEVVVKCKSCGLPYLRYGEAPADDLRFCTSECQLAYYARGHVPLYAEEREQCED